MVLQSFLKMQRKNTKSGLRVKHNEVKAEMHFIFLCSFHYDDSKREKI